MTRLDEQARDTEVVAVNHTRLITMGEAITEALSLAFDSDPSVFLIGEDVGVMGGVSGQTRGLYERFGPTRVIDAPISEAAFLGLAAGAAQCGMRPVVELMRVDFFGVAMDMIYNYIAKVGYCTNGTRRVPVTVMTQVGNPLRQGAVHAQTLYATFAHVPGLKLVAPATSRDAKGLLLAAIRCQDPVIFFLHSSLIALPYGPGLEEETSEHVPLGDYEVPIGEARVARSGSDLTIVAWSWMLHESLRAAKVAASQGIECEVIDLRSLVPLDIETVCRSVERTGRLLVVDEDYTTAGLAAEIITAVCERGTVLRAAPRRITREQVPIPYSQVLDDEVRPSVARITESITSCYANV